MSDTNLTPGVGSLSLIGRSQALQIPAFQLNGTDDATQGALPPFQLNGTDVSGGVRLPPFQLPGSNVTRVTGTGSLSLTGQNATVLNSANPSYVVIPSPATLSLTGAAPTVTTLQIPNFFTPAAGAAAITGYSPTLFVAGAFTLPLRTVSATGSPGFDARFTLPLRDLSATGKISVLGDVSFTTPLRTITTAAQDGAVFSTPLRSLSATGIVGVLATAAFDRSLISLSATANVSVNASASFSTLLRTLSSTALMGINASIAFSTPKRTLSATAMVGIVGSTSFSTPLRTLSTLGFPSLTAVGSFTTPLRYLTAAGFPLPSENYRAWVMNVRTGSLVEYENFKFNSLVKFGEAYLGAGPNGLFVLGGDTDNGAQIDSLLRTGLDGFGDSFLKRVPRIYWQGNQEGDLWFSTITTEDGKRTYALTDNGIRGEQQRRVPIGKGPKAVRWQFEIVNRNGAKFGVSRVLVYPQNLRRRIQ